MQRIQKKWTISEIKFIEDNIDTLTWKEMAQHLGRPVKAVKAYNYRYILAKKSPGNGSYTRWTLQENELLLKLWGTVTIDEISKMMNRTVHTVSSKYYRLKNKPQISINS